VSRGLQYSPHSLTLSLTHSLAHRYIFDTRLLLANDDDFESVGWLAELYNGDLPKDESACGVNKEVAWKLFKEAATLGDEKSSFDMAMSYWRGTVPGEAERNVTRCFEILDDIIARQGEGWVVASVARTGIGFYEVLYRGWRWYVELVTGVVRYIGARGGGEL